eukprot:gene20189-7239_t
MSRIVCTLRQDDNEVNWIFDGFDDAGNAWFNTPDGEEKAIPDTYLTRHMITWMTFSMNPQLSFQIDDNDDEDNPLGD